MDEQSLLYISVLSLVLSVIILICYFKLCANVARIRKSLPSDEEEYYVNLKMGNKEEAYRHLQRWFYLKQYKSSSDMSSDDARTFYKKFKELGLGIPDESLFDEFKKKEKAP